MSMKNFIYISPGRSQFFRSDIKEKAEGFSLLKSYVLPCGDIDHQAFDDDRQALMDDGWTEIPSPHYMDIHLYYMRESGKFYSEGVYKVRRSEAIENPAQSWYNAIEAIRELVATGNLPGLVKGAKFETFVICDEHPCNVPTLIRI